MKSVADLNKLRDAHKVEVKLRDVGHQEFDVYVAMGDAGIEAGAKKVFHTLAEEVLAQDLPVLVKQEANKNLEGADPVVEVYDKEGNRTIYVNMTPEKAKEVVESHLKEHNRIVAYTLEGN